MWTCQYHYKIIWEEMNMLFRGNGRPYRILQLRRLFDFQFWKILKLLNCFIEATLRNEWYIVINYLHFKNEM